MDYYILVASIYGLGLIAAIVYYILQIDRPGSGITSNLDTSTLCLAILAVSLIWPAIASFRLRRFARSFVGGKRDV